MASALGVQIDMEYAITNFSGVSIKYTLDVISAMLGHTLPDDFESEFRERTFAAFKTDLKAVEGVPELLEQLKVPFCVASSGPVEKLELSLSTTGLIHFFRKRIFSSYDIGRWKPEPDIFLYAARQMGFEPYDCAVVEDSLAGIEAACRGGFDVYALSRNGNDLALADKGAVVFSSMLDLYSILR